MENMTNDILNEVFETWMCGHDDHKGPCPPEGCPKGRCVRAARNVTQHLEAPMEQQIYDALTTAAEVVCETKCSSVWKTGEKQPHSDECKKVKAARSAWMDHCSTMDLIASGGIQE